MFHFIVKNGSFSSDHRAPGLCTPKESKKERSSWPSVQQQAVNVCVRVCVCFPPVCGPPHRCTMVSLMEVENPGHNVLTVYIQITLLFYAFQVW